MRRIGSNISWANSSSRPRIRASCLSVNPDTDRILTPLDDGTVEQEIRLQTANSSNNLTEQY
ncbi:MAG: hypothetical protein R2736_19680 [Solirubrobacterales bacterium]